MIRHIQTGHGVHTMGEVIKFTGVTRIPCDAPGVLDGAKEFDLDTVIVLGRTQDGDLYFDSTTPDGGDVLWLMRLIEKHLISGAIP